MSHSLTVPEAEQLACSWQHGLRAQRKSPQTLKTYGDGVRQYLAWCTENDAEPLARSSLNLFTAHLLDQGAAAATARSRQLGVRRFAAWLAEEGEIAADPFLGIKSPKLDERVVEPLSDADLRALVKVCLPPTRAIAPAPRPSRPQSPSSAADAPAATGPERAPTGSGGRAASAAGTRSRDRV